MGVISPSPLCKFILFLSFVSVALDIVGVASPYWLTSSFVLMGAGNLPVDANMGLFTACNEIKWPNKSPENDCSADDARDWQFVAAAFAVVGLVLAFLSLLGTVLVVCVSKLKGSFKIQVLSTVSNFFSAAASVVPLVLYGMNRRFMVDSGFPSELKDFDIDWAFSVSAACAFLFLSIFTFNVIDLIVCDHSSGSGVNDIEPYDAYSGSVKKGDSVVQLVGRTS